MDRELHRLAVVGNSHLIKNRVVGGEAVCADPVVRCRRGDGHGVGVAGGDSFGRYADDCVSTQLAGDLDFCAGLEIDIGKSGRHFLIRNAIVGHPCVSGDGECRVVRHINTAAQTVRVHIVARDLAAVHIQCTAGDQRHAAADAAGIMGDLAVFGSRITAAAVAEG